MMANACSLELECDTPLIIASRHGVPVGRISIGGCAKGSYIAVIGIEKIIHFKENFRIINGLVVHRKIPNTVIFESGRNLASISFTTFSSPNGTPIEAGIKFILCVGATKI